MGGSGFLRGARQGGAWRVVQGRARRPGQRRVRVPGIAELLRPASQLPAESEQRQASGREGHSHKITVYLSESDLLELERARLTFRPYRMSAHRAPILSDTLAV